MAEHIEIIGDELIIGDDDSEIDFEKEDKEKEEKEDNYQVDINYESDSDCYLDEKKIVTLSQNSENEYNIPVTEKAKEEEEKEEEEKEEKEKVLSKKKKKIFIQRIDIDENIETVAETSHLKENCKNCEINRELLNMVVNLTRKIDNLENEFKELKKIMTIQKIPSNEIPPVNKKNVLEWLNKYIVPTMSYDEFLENIEVTMNHFEFLLDYKLTDTIQKIIDKNIVKNEDVIYPLYSNIEKTGKVYIYDSENNIWENVNLEYLCKFVKQIVDKLSQTCILWKKKHSDKNDSDSQCRCQSALLKLYNVSYTQDAMMNRVRHDLCQKMKIVCK